MSATVTAFLLQLEPDRWVFYTEPASSLGSGAGPGNRGSKPRRFRRLRIACWKLFRRLRDSARETENQASPRLRRPLYWHLRQRPHDERLLRRLLTCQEFEILHSPTLARNEVERLWSQQLQESWSIHLRGFAINLAISPLTLILMPLPGPNVIGYWFVYRSICHGLALWGVQRARRNRFPIAFETDLILDGPVANDEEKARQIASRFHLKDLGRFLRTLKPTSALVPVGSDEP